MYLSRVVGTVVAARKYAGLEGIKLLIVQPLDHAQRPSGDPHVACDTVQAGPGDLVPPDRAAGPHQAPSVAGSISQSSSVSGPPNSFSTDLMSWMLRTSLALRS